MRKHTHEQLLTPLQYIAPKSGNLDVAYGHLSKIEQAVLLLAEQPQMGGYPRCTALKRQGYRALTVQKHLVFYKVRDAEKTVTIPQWWMSGVNTAICFKTMHAPVCITLLGIIPICHSLYG